VARTVSDSSRRAYSCYWKKVAARWGELRLDEPSPSDVKQLGEYIRGNVVVRRNARGGGSAVENFITALRCPYNQAIAEGHIIEADNPARKVSKPNRPPSTRHAVPDARLAETNQITAATGNDPALDTLLLRLYIVISRLPAVEKKQLHYTCATLGSRIGEVSMATSTSFRISDVARRRLAARAATEGVSATALLDRLIVEGVDQLDHPGIVFRGPAHDRRAGLVAGPDVWEVIARLQELRGSEEHRIAVLAAESELHPRLIRLAVDYAAEHPDDVRRCIEKNRALVDRSRRASRQREALLA